MLVRQVKTERHHRIAEFLNIARLLARTTSRQVSTSIALVCLAASGCWATEELSVEKNAVTAAEVETESSSVAETTEEPLSELLSASSVVKPSGLLETLGSEIAPIESANAVEFSQAEAEVQASAAKPTPSERTLQETAPQESVISKANHSVNLSREQLFEQVFGPSGEMRAAILPWSINGRAQGDLPVQIDVTNDEMQWPVAGFAQALAVELQDEWLETIYNLAQNGSLSRLDLTNAGIETQFDSQTLQLNVILTPEQRRPNVVSFQTSKEADEAPTVAAAKLSGYLNTRGSVGWTWLPEAGDTAGAQPVALQWDGAINYQGWVLEGRTRFLEDSPNPWQRGDFRLVHDRPQLATRFKAGEISAPIVGYQRGTSILGVSATRQFGLQPDRVTRPVSNYEFFLASPSKVEVFINGDRDRILDLPAGTQDLRDLALGAGINDIELLITDSVGQEQQLRFFAPVAAQLLGPGIQQFAYSLGAPIEQDAGARSYDFNKTLLTASHRWGMTPTLTTGGYLQANLSQQMLGTEGVKATPLGSWDWDAAMSLDPDAGLGYGAQVGYEYRRTGDAQQKSLRLGLEYRNDSFLAVGEDEPNNRIPLETSLSYRQKLIAQIDANVSGRYQWTEDGNAYRVSLKLNRPVGQGRRLGLSLSHSQKAEGDAEQQVRVNFLMSMPQRRQTLNASTESNLAGDVTRRMSWNYRDRPSINTFNTGLNVADDGDSWDVSHRLNWRGYRATLGLKTDATGDRDSMLDWSGMESQLSFGTGLVFADGRFGWSRPVDGSFALLVPHQQLRGQGIEVNPSSQRAAAVIDRWGAAVLPGLSAYKMNTLNLDSPALPLGYSLGLSSHRLKPGYRQGTLVTVGNDATVFLRGVLQFADGNRPELKLGEVSSLDDSAWKVKTLFTNRVGKFALEGFKPGRYQIRLTEGETVEFMIPEDAAGIFDIGALQLTPAPVDAEP